MSSRERICHLAGICYFTHGWTLAVVDSVQFCKGMVKIVFGLGKVLILMEPIGCTVTLMGKATNSGGKK